MRLAMLEARKRAEDALEKLETEVEREHPPNWDGDEIKLH
jgi:hypothetical protein